VVARKPDTATRDPETRSDATSQQVADLQDPVAVP
jgi:hypothetical protein